tara:strand:+ start:146 stop:268 length:123 start_codon:yes stop_codon:yes gene_type:complete
MFVLTKNAFGEAFLIINSGIRIALVLASINFMETGAAREN